MCLQRHIINLNKMGIEAKTIEYAMKRLRVIEMDNNDIRFISMLKDGEHTIVCFFKSGHNIELCKDEIKHQAKEYLNSEIERIEDN